MTITEKFGRRSVVPEPSAEKRDTPRPHKDGEAWCTSKSPLYPGSHGYDRCWGAQGHPEPLHVSASRRWSEPQGEPADEREETKALREVLAGADHTAAKYWRRMVDAERDLKVAREERDAVLAGKHVPLADLEAAWRVGAEHKTRADAAEKALAERAETQGAPSDAQVLAAVDAFMASQLESEDGHSLVHKNMAAALRAAGVVTEQGESQ